MPSSEKEWLNSNLDGYREWYGYYKDFLQKELLKKRPCTFYIANLESKLREITKKGQSCKKQIELLDTDSCLD